MTAEFGAEELRALLPSGAAATLAALLPGIGAPDPAIDTPDARARMFEYLLELLAQLAAQRPCVLVIEDAHWADASSRDLLDFLVRSQQAAPGLMIIVTLRAAELRRAHPLRRQVAELTRVPWVHRIDLAPLSRPDVVRQARAILGVEPDPELVQTVYQRSEGNPLFVEALLECEQSGQTNGVPPSLEDLLLSRVEALPMPAAQIVRVAAVAGQRVGHRLLAKVIERSTMDPSGLDEALRIAVDATVLTVDGDGYRFRHSLFREAVYQNLLPGERAELHAHYADVLETEAGVTQGEPPAAEIANHLFSANDIRRGVTAAWTASRQAHQSLAYSEELTVLGCIVELWPELPDAADRVGTDLAGVLERAVEAAVRSGAHADGEALATRALALLDPERERVRTALMLERRGTMRASLGLPTALSDLRAAVDTIPQDHSARAFLLNSLADHLLQVPLPEEAKRAAREALRIACRVGDAPAEASALITLAVAEARLGDVDGQLPHFARARAIADGVGATQVALRAWHREAHLLQAFGRLEPAAALARSGLQAAKSAGLARAEGPRHVIDLAGPLIGAGKWDDAVEAVEYGLGLAPPPSYQAHLLCYKGFVALHRGDLELARHVVERVAVLLAEDPFPQDDPLQYERLAAELRLAQGRVGDAIDVIEAAVSRDDLLPASRYLWPTLTLGATAASAALSDANDSLHARGTELLKLLHERASLVRIAGPVQHAWSVTFVAEASAAAGGGKPELWTAAVSAWDELGQPLRLAQALLGAAEDALGTGGERQEVGGWLRRAATMATELGAKSVAERAESLARRARISLGGQARRSSSEVPHGLTPRELEILRLVAVGRSNSEIAAELFIAPKTASVHVSNILSKLGVANRVEAAAAAHQLGLVEVSSGAPPPAP